MFFALKDNLTFKYCENNYAQILSTTFSAFYPRRKKNISYIACQVVVLNTALCLKTE